MFKVTRFVVLIALVVAAVGFTTHAPAPVEARAMCTLININEPAQPGQEGEGMGRMWQGYLESGTVLEYDIDYSGENGGGGFNVFAGLVNNPMPPGDVFSDMGGVPLGGSFTIPSSGNYTIDAGAGSDSVQEAMVSVLVNATCQDNEGVDLTCNTLATVSGYPANNSTPFEGTAGALVTIVAESSNPQCPVEGNLHQGSCEGPVVTQAIGMGTGTSTVQLPATGTYEICLGGVPPWAEGCWETPMTVTAYEGCELQMASIAGCPAMMAMNDDTVMGTFVSNADTYWKPGNLTSPLITLDAGKSAYVLGVDETGAYYKIIWVCNYLWVPVETLGPTYDANWNGAPLPAGIVF